jgi:DNA-binding IscR family transcriptional regulator
MPTIPGATPQQQKVYDALHSGGFMNENKLQDADKIALAAKLPKGMAAQALLDLEKQGYVRRVARGKAAGYYITKEPGAVVKPKGDGEFSADDIF